jgi:glycine cleavage system H protein
MKIIDYEYPSDRKYLINHTPAHLWFKRDAASNKVLMGLTDFFQKRIGEINEITLRENGSEISISKVLGLVKAKNYSAILKSPIAFKIIETNEKITKRPQMINEDPYEKGWLYKIEVIELENVLGEKLVSPEEKALEQFLQVEIANNALLGSDCCPDFIGGSGIARRKKRD